MRKGRKFTGLLLAAAMLAGLLTGCGSTKTDTAPAAEAPQPQETSVEAVSESTAAEETETVQKPDTSEPVTLTMYLIGTVLWIMTRCLPKLMNGCRQKSTPPLM